MNIKKIKTLKIDRAKWRTGDTSDYQTGRGHTRLLNEHGFMCCLGFYCQQSGVPKDKLLDVTTPDGIPEVQRIPLMTIKGMDTEFAAKAIDINDDDIAPSVREKKLKRAFKSRGVNVIFTGKYKHLN